MPDKFWPNFGQWLSGFGSFYFVIYVIVAVPAGILTMKICNDLSSSTFYSNTSYVFTPTSNIFSFRLHSLWTDQFLYEIMSIIQNGDEILT